jgi:predicted nucleic acid-binding protein
LNVVDASVLVEYLAAGEQVEAAREAIRRSAGSGPPALVDAEVGRAVRRQARGGEISARNAASGLRTEVELIGEG